MKIIVAQKDLDKKYQEWLDENGLEAGVHHGNSALLFKKDESDAWTDDDGHGYKALSDQKIWEAGWCAAMIEMYNSVMTGTYSTKD